MQIRLGYEISYQCPQPTPMILTLHVHYTRAGDLIRPDNMITDPWVPLTLYRDGFGNWCTRLVAPAGFTSFYINSRDGKFRYEDFFLQEFMPAMEKRYRIGTTRSQRGLDGGGRVSINTTTVIIIIIII